MGVVDSLKRNWRTRLVIVTPIVLSSLIITSGTQSSKCAFMLGVCTIYWVTESLPLPMTSLLPFVMAPVLGVLTIDDACQAFFGDFCAMIMGVFFVGAAIEDSNLHRRIALNVLLFIGVQPKRLLFSLMLTSGFLSMWVTNIRAASMMAPIVQILMIKLLEARRETTSTVDNDDEIVEVKAQSKGIKMKKRCINNDIISIHDDVTDNDVIRTQEDVTSNVHQQFIRDNGDSMIQENREWNQMNKIFQLAICYSANIGGIGTLMGAPPNLVLANAVNDLVKNGESPVTYVSWLMFGIPVSMVTLMLAYIWLSVCLFGLKNTLLCRKVDDEDETRMLRKVLVKEYKSLGTMTFHEKVVLGHFIVLILLLFCRNPGFAPGFASLFPPKYISDAFGAIAVSTSLFIWPRSRPNVFCFRTSQDSTPPRSQQAALTWETACRTLQWGTIFLFGGGVVLAQAIKSSGLGNDIGEYLMFVSQFPTWLTVLVMSSLVCVATEMTSNTVISIITLPILGNLALQLHVNPLHYMLSAAVASSMAFMLPVRTAPTSNSIIYSLGHVKIVDMAKVGLIVKLLGILSINVLLNSVAFYAFSLGEFPSWATTTHGIMNRTEATMNSTIYNNAVENVTMATIESVWA